MAGRVCEDPPTAGVGVEQGGAEGEDLVLGLAEVGDVEVQMELLREGGVRPLRRLVVLQRWNAKTRPEPV